MEDGVHSGVGSLGFCIILIFFRLGTFPPSHIFGFPLLSLHD